MTRPFPAHSSDDVPTDTSGGRLEHLAELASVQSAFVRALPTIDPEAPIATCAPWAVADLALHLTRVYWGAAGMAVGVVLRAPEPDRPRDPETLERVVRWAARHVHETLVEAGPDGPALTLDGRGKAGYWRRRLLHETLVHLTDLESAGARVQLPSAPAVWADGVAEVVDVVGPGRVHRGLVGKITAPVLLVATDVPARWRLGPSPGDPVVVRGTARQLDMLLWNRTPPNSPRLQISGDTAAVAHLVSVGLTP